MKIKTSLIYDKLIGNFLSIFFGTLVMSLGIYVNGDHYGIFEGYWTQVVGIFIASFWVIRLHAYYEAERIEIHHVQIDHRLRFFQRTTIAAVFSVLVHLLAEGWSVHMLRVSAFSTLYIGGIFWLLFDFMLNHDRGKALLYVSAWYGSAWLDRVFRRLHSPLLWTLSKILIFFLTLHLYVKSF